MTKVTAIITTHNRCELLKKAIKSVLNQTYKNIEIIVVDDNSDDNTEKYMQNIIKENPEIKYKRLTNKNLSGGNYARNVGIKESTGEYIAFLDDDDEWMPEKIEKQVNVLKNNNDVDLVICGKIVEYNFGEKYEEGKYFLEKKQNCSKLILYKIIGVTSTMMFSKNILNEVGYFDEKLKFWQEYDLSIRICQKSKVYFLNEPLILYRINEKDKNRKTNKIDGWYADTQYIKEKYKNLIDKLSDDEKKKVDLNIYQDGVKRCSLAKDKKRKKEFLKNIYTLEPNLKNFIKYFFNINGIKNKIKKLSKIKK